MTFAQYAAPLLGLPTGAQVPLAVGAIVLLAGVNYLGVKPGAVVQNIFTLLKLAALAVLIIAGIFIATSTAPYRPLPPPTAHSAGLWSVVAAVGAALVPVLFTCGGWQQTNFIAEEIIEPERNLPRALVLGVVIVVVVYVLANVAYLETLGAAGLAASTAPAADAMRVALGPGGGTLIAVGIALSTFGFLNLVILVTPRVLQAMAADGLFFAGIARLHPRYRTPAAAIAVQAAWAILLTLSGTYGQLLDYVVFGDWIFFGLSVATLFVYRRRDAVRDRLSAGPPDRPVFRTPGYPWVPGFFVLAALYVMTGSVLSNPANALRGAGLLALGLPVFWLWRRQRLAASRDGA